MPVWGRRGSYVAVTWTVVALAIVGSLSALVRRAIPPPPSNQLSSNSSRFLNRAGHQLVHWRLMEDDPFAEARRLDLPVMVFAGTAASQAARKFDDATFAHQEVAARLNRDFVSVRVDLVTEPEWRGAFLPILRNQVGTDPGFTLWFFSPDGRLLTWVGRRTWNDNVDYNDLLGTLSDVSNQWREIGSDESTRAQREQREEVDALRGGHTVALPDFLQVDAGLQQRDPFAEWQPGTYRTLLAEGSLDLLNSTLLPKLLSPQFDLVDGGFFRLSSGADTSQVEFDKSASVNAEMLAVVARAWLATGDPVYKYAYERAARCMVDRFLSGDQWSSFVEAHVADDGRSPRHSFGVAALRTEFSGPARDFAGQLDLDPRRNPLMVPVLSRKVLTGERKELDAFVREAQTIGDPRADVGSNDSVLDSAGIVCARTIEAAWMMGDTETLSVALDRSRRLLEFRAGTDEVVHSTQGRGRRRKWLGDFTSYADAMLQVFIATGDESSLSDGERVLRRALELYTRAQKGDVVSTSEFGPADIQIELPSIVDNGVPPALPALMRLCYRYGCVLGDEDLRSVAFDIAERFASVANQEPGSFQSYFGAADEVINARCNVYGVEVSPAEVAMAARGRPGSFYAKAAASNKDVPMDGLRRYARQGPVPAK